MQPWKQGDAAESRVVAGTIAIASLPTRQHQQLNNREAGPSNPDAMNYGPLEKNHVVPPSSQDVALCRYSVSGEVPL